MSLMQKCQDYVAAHGKLPSFPEMDNICHQQLAEYLDALSDAVIPEYHDRAIITAAYKLLYEARYNMLEPEEKALCDKLVNTSVVTSTERTVEI